MPKRRGETEQEWMERLRRFREMEREDMFEQVAAARTYIDRVDGGRRPGLEMQAFMSIFHPDHALTGTPEGLKIAREMDEKARKNR